MPANEWKAGQVVTVFNGFTHEPSAIRKVARVMKRFVELDDGTKWDEFGHEYPYQRGSYHRPTIKPATDAHARNRTAVDSHPERGRSHAQERGRTTV